MVTFRPVRDDMPKYIFNLYPYCVPMAQSNQLELE